MCITQDGMGGGGASPRRVEEGGQCGGSCVSTGKLSLGVADACSCSGSMSVKLTFGDGREGPSR